jgi:hypothetical protein
MPLCVRYGSSHILGLGATCLLGGARGVPGEESVLQEEEAHEKAEDPGGAGAERESGDQASSC